MLFSMTQAAFWKGWSTYLRMHNAWSWGRNRREYRLPSTWGILHCSSLYADLLFLFLSLFTLFCAIYNCYSNKSAVLHFQLLKKCFLHNQELILLWGSWSWSIQKNFRSTPIPQVHLQMAQAPFPPPQNNFQTSGSRPFSPGAYIWPSAPNAVSAEPSGLSSRSTFPPAWWNISACLLQQHLRRRLSNTGFFTPFPSCISFLISHLTSSSWTFKDRVSLRLCLRFASPWKKEEYFSLRGLAL